MEENYNLQMLLETKSFEALTAEEKKFVLQEITEEEFRSRRMMLKNIKLFLKEGVKESNPKKSIQRNVLAVMKAEQKETGWNKIILFRIPAYAVAAIIALLLMAYPFLYDETKTLIKEETTARNENSAPKTIYKTDTVYVEKEIPKIVKEEKVKYITVYKDENCTSDILNHVVVNKEESSIDEMNSPGFFTVARLENQLNVIGKPTSTQNELNQFLVVGN